MERTVIWPGWETVRLIGRGSFGAVYEIQRTLFGEVERAALKVITIPQNVSDIEELRSNGFDKESITSTFRSHLKSIVSEYSLMRKMNGCTNIVNCDDVRYVQHDDGIGWDIYIKMELLTPLNQALPDAIPEELVIKIAVDLCTALELCERFDIVHRDIKPQNIFVSDIGDYKLGDFGIAKTVEKTIGGTKIGTYRYMAPEVYNNQPYGSAADIYSLGLVLYWLLNERRMPFLPLPPAKLSAKMDEDARTRRLQGEPLPAPKHGSEELKRIVLKACTYDPKKRYPDAVQMREDINRLANGSTVLAEPAHIPPAETVPYSEDTTVLDEVYQKRNTSSSQVSQASPPKNETSHTVLLPAEELPPRSVSRGKRKRGLPLIAACLSGVILLALALLYIGIQQNQAKKQAQLQEAYIAAEKLYESGEYDEAIAAFEALNDYQDSADIILEVQYAKARKILKEGNYDEALAVFSALGDYADSSEQAKSAQLMVDYRAAEALLKEGKYEQAIVAFTALGNYRDSVQQVQKAQQALNYEAAAALLKEGAYEEAITAFEALGNYRDSVEQMENARLAADTEEAVTTEPPHVHSWVEATCATPKTCYTCGEINGSALGHQWIAATCTTPRTCSLCGETSGSALGHQWIAATCTAPKTCSVCGETSGSALNHQWNEATCTSAQSCQLCGESVGKPLPHSWSKVNYNTALCENCGIKKYNMMASEYIGHRDFEKRSDSFLWGQSSFRRSDVSSIVFSDAIGNAPGTAWDVSAARDKSILAWMNGGCLTIASAGIIGANQNSSWLFANFKNLTSIDFSDRFDTSSVINMNAMFAGCMSVPKLDLSTFVTSSVTDMGGMFNDCHELVSVDVSSFDTSNVRHIQWMFGRNFKLSSVDISGFNIAKDTEADCMFYICKSLSSVILPDNITRIGNSAFESCAKLNNVIIPQGVTTIGAGAFSYCTNLSSINIPYSVTSIGQNAFNSCFKIKSVTINSRCTVGDGAFPSTCEVIRQLSATSTASKNTERNTKPDATDQALEAQQAADYAAAEKLYQAGNYDQAIAAFDSLGEYSDSADRVLEVRYAQASRWLSSGKYGKAITAFEALNGYKDSAAQIAKARQASEYAAAEALEHSGKTAQAAMAFYAMGEKERSFELWSTLTMQESVSAGFGHTVGLKADGTVVAVGLNTAGECNVSSWKNIVSLSAAKAGVHTVGLRNDGTVVAAGNNTSGRCDVSKWCDIVAIRAGTSHTVGLKADGTVVAVGSNLGGQCDVSKWHDIVAIGAGTLHTVGLKADGTVVAVGKNEYGQCDVSNWRDIVAISVGDSHTVGLKADGTVVAVGPSDSDVCNVSKWRNIVAISAGTLHTVGLKADGTVVATGTLYDRGQCNVGSWRDIIAISAGFTHTVGLKADGSVVAVGENEYGKCNVSSWEGIKLPNK